jgi:hypothetical protein
LALLRRAEVWLCSPDIWEALSLGLKEL